MDEFYLTNQVDANRLNVGAAIGSPTYNQLFALYIPLYYADYHIQSAEV